MDGYVYIKKTAISSPHGGFSKTSAGHDNIGTISNRSQFDGARQQSPNAHRFNPYAVASRDAWKEGRVPRAKEKKKPKDKVDLVFEPFGGHSDVRAGRVMGMDVQNKLQKSTNSEVVSGSRDEHVQDLQNVFFETFSNPPSSPPRSGQEPRSFEPSGGAIPSPAASTIVRRKDLYNLKDPSNPITHSIAKLRSQQIHSSVTGHQRGGGTSSAYNHYRDEKLKGQTEPSSDGNQMLRGARVYVDGYTEGTTRSEIARLVDLHGGSNLRTASGATHIITSMALSASKTQKQLSAKKLNKQQVVKPSWLYDSIEAGKKLNEWKYRIINDESQSVISWTK